MSAVTFDTYKFVERLEKAGATRELAAALVEVQKETLAEAMDSQLATKNDVTRLENRIEMVRHEITADIIKWVAGMLLAQAAIIAALVKLL